MVLIQSAEDQRVRKEETIPNVPLSKARAMSPSQRRAAVSRKQSAERRTRRGKRPNYART